MAVATFEATLFEAAGNPGGCLGCFHDYCLSEKKQLFRSVEF